MFGDVQGPRKSPEQEKVEYMPFSCTELNQGLIDYARTHLNETEEAKKKGIQEMKEFVKRTFLEELKGSCKNMKKEMVIPEFFYLLFLRARKFDIKRACSLLKNGADFIDTHRTIFDRVDSEAVRKTIHSKVVGFLPYRDAKGRAILYVRSECWNPRELKTEDVIFGSIVALHVAGENPVNQVAGFVVILDLKNLTTQQVLSISNWILFGLQALQKCCPCLLKEAHIVHTPPFIRATWTMVKTILSDKIRKRIIFYKSMHWGRFHRHISPSILPEELGGQLGPFSYEHWASDIADIENKYNTRLNMFLNRWQED